MITYMTRNMKPLSFKKEINSNKGVSLVRFCTEWNGSCRIMAETLKELESYYSSFIRFYTIDVDKEPQMAREFGIHEIPALLIFKNGVVIDRITGSVAKNILIEKMNALLPHKNKSDYHLYL